MADEWFWAGSAGQGDDDFSDGYTESAWQPQNYLYGSVITCGKSGTCTKLSVHCQSSSGTPGIKIGLFSSSGSLIAESSLTNGSGFSWRESGAIDVDVTAQDYIVMLSSETSAAQWRFDSAAAGIGETVGYASAMPSSISTTEDESGTLFGIKMWVEDAAAGTAVSASTDALAITKYSANIDLNFTPTTDSLILTENTTGVALDIGIGATTDALVITENSAGIVYDVGVTTILDALSITANSAGIVHDVVVTNILDELLIAEQAAIISLGVNVGASVDALLLTENQSTVSLDILISATTDALVLTEYIATLGADVNISTILDTLVLTEYSASIGLNIVTTLDTLILTEHAAEIATGINISTGTNALTLTEYGVGITFDVVVSATSDTLVITRYTVSVGTGLTTSATYGINLHTGDLIHIFTP